MNKCLNCHKNITQFLLEKTGYIRVKKLRKWCDRKCYDAYRHGQAIEKVRLMTKSKCLNCKKFFIPVRIKENGILKDSHYDKKFCTFNCWIKFLHKNRKKFRVVGGKEYVRYSQRRMSKLERQMYEKELYMKDLIKRVDNFVIRSSTI